VDVRILWGSPLPPVKSGVSDYAVELLPRLARRCAVRVLVPPGCEADRIAGLCPGCEPVPADAPLLPGEVPVLNLGNNPHHLWLVPRLGEGRPVVVLHDLVLHHLLVEATVTRGDMAAYAGMLGMAEPVAGPVLARARGVGFSGRRDPFLFPARKAFLEGARAVVVHSRWAAGQVGDDRPDLPILVLPLPTEDPGEELDRASLRGSIGAADGGLVVMHLGFLTPAKGLAEIVGGLAVARRLGVPVRLVLVGEGAAEPILEAAARLGLEGNVAATGWVDPRTLRRLPAAADLGVVLRTPSAGETSAAVLRFLAAGTPVAVGGLHQFLEWPIDAAPRITPGPSAMAELARLLVSIDRERGGTTGGERRVRARETYVKGGHHPGVAAETLADFLEGVAG